MELREIINTESVSVDRNVNFPDKLEKTRRNLIVVSALVLGICYMGKSISKITLLGADISLEDDAKVYVVLFCVLLYETIMFLLRFTTFILHNSYRSWAEHLERVLTLDRDAALRLSVKEKVAWDVWHEEISSWKFRVKAIAIFLMSYCAEGGVPLALSIYAFIKISLIVFG